MRNTRSSETVRRAAMIVSLSLLGNCVVQADAPRLEPGKIVESRAVSDNPNYVLDSYVVSVHTILQVHTTPIVARRATQDTSALAACQDRVLSTALDLARKGITAVVVEGFYAEGPLKSPQPLTRQSSPRSDEIDAKWALLGQKELAVYGFAVRYLNDYSNAVVNDLGKSSAIAQSIEKNVGKESSVAQKAAVDQLVQEEVTRVSIFRAGIVPTASFLGLQTALAVALARNERQVQLVIGKDHWDDLVYAINRQKDIRVRLVPYQCP